MEYEIRRSSHAWTTGDELAFLAGLGTHSTSVQTPRTVLLQRYLAAARRRTSWGGVASGKILHAVRVMLRGDD